MLPMVLSDLFPIPGIYIYLPLPLYLLRLRMSHIISQTVVKHSKCLEEIKHLEMLLGKNVI